jgi:Uma2 family endonuclease
LWFAAATSADPPLDSAKAPRVCSASHEIARYDRDDSVTDRSVISRILSHAGATEENRTMHMALRTRRWTRTDLDRMPEDGNTYEVIRGELFVTPPPSVSHQDVILRLTDLLFPYVSSKHIGRVHFPRSVVVFEGSQAEPDMMVLPPSPPIDAWERMPAPLLVVEVLSRSTARRDRVAKRAYYLDAGAAEYWMVDREAKSITIARRGAADVVVTDMVRWQPVADREPLVIDVAAVFG